MQCFLEQKNLMGYELDTKKKKKEKTAVTLYKSSTQPLNSN